MKSGKKCPHHPKVEVSGTWIPNVNVSTKTTNHFLSKNNKVREKIPNKKGIFSKNKWWFLLNLGYYHH